VKYMAEKLIKVKILRFNPSTNGKAYFQSYDVPLTEGVSVLDILDFIYENLDGSLAYYDHAACRHGICGGCSLVVNGKPSLACQTLVLGNISVEPPKNFKVIRDLVYKRGELK